jgi:hypothetical protein
LSSTRALRWCVSDRTHVSFSFSFSFFSFSSFCFFSLTSLPFGFSTGGWHGLEDQGPNRRARKAAGRDRRGRLRLPIIESATCQIILSRIEGRGAKTEEQRYSRCLCVCITGQAAGGSVHPAAAAAAAAAAPPCEERRIESIKIGGAQPSRPRCRKNTYTMP